MGEPHVQGPQVGGPVRQITQETFDRLNQNISAEVTEMFKKASKDTDIHKLGVAMSLLQLLDAESLGKDKDQTLEAYDSEARNVLGPRRSLIKRIVEDLMKKPVVKTGFTEANKRGLIKTFGSGYKLEIQKFANYIISDAFYNELGTMNEEQRRKRLAGELGKLTALDPELAQQTSIAFMAKEIANNPHRVIKQLTPEEARKAVEGVLALIAQMPDDPSAAQALIGEAKKSGELLSTGSKLRTLLADTKTRRLVSAALGRAMTHRSYYGALGDEQEAARLINKLKTDGHSKAAEVVERLKAGSAVGRGIASFTSLVALAGIVATFPPVDANGNVNWAQVGSMSSGGLSAAGNIPTLGQFLGTDMTPVIAKWIGAEFKLSRAAVSGGSKLAKITSVAKFAKVCDWLGPIGDAISLPVSIVTMMEESKNEDTVGVVSNAVGTAAGILGLTGGICLLFGSTGVGLPLAAVAAVIGLGAAAVDWFFSESAMTGQIRQDLRYLGVSTAEEQTYEDIVRHTVTRTAQTREGPYQYTSREDRPAGEVRGRAKKADMYQKVQLINQYMEGRTSGADEQMIYDILLDTLHAGSDYLKLVEALDTKRLASELEGQGQAKNVLVWTAKAYEKAGTPPGKAFDAFILQIAYEHREEVINAFMGEIEKSAYHSINPQTIVDCAWRLVDGHTDSSEQKTIYRMFQRTNYPQFNDAMQSGGLLLTRRLKSELSSSEWKNFRSWMLDTAPGKASPHVKHLAVQAGR